VQTLKEKSLTFPIVCHICLHTEGIEFSHKCCRPKHLCETRRWKIQKHLPLISWSVTFVQVQKMKVKSFPIIDNLGLLTILHLYRLYYMINSFTTYVQESEIVCHGVYTQKECNSRTNVVGRNICARIGSHGFHHILCILLTRVSMFFISIWP
jgi:hypothetical protein